MSKNKKFRIISFKNSKPILRAKNISKIIDNRSILQNLNLSINPSEIVGLLGPNGAGKSVTFKILLGIMKADKGEISVSGASINNLPVHERSSKFKIGYIPQNESIFTGLSCEENLKAIAEIVIKNKDERQNIVENLLNEFSLNDVRKVIAKNLSGGQKKKLVIARSLINKPRILLMDEVFSAIDPITIEVIKDIIINLQKRGISILITDHAFDNVLQISDKVFIISDGQIVSSGKPQEIVKDQQARKIYFGDTY
jgi:lipopolysaccharide export system ATP-binding protein